MSVNQVFSKIGQRVETVAGEIVKGAEDVLTVGAKVIKVIADARALSPQFKADLATLVDDAKAIAIPLTPVLASGGENISADMAAIVPLAQDVMKLAKDFVAFLPNLETALKQIDVDLSA